MFEPHQGTIGLCHSFEAAHEFLSTEGKANLVTAAGTEFQALAVVACKGSHSGKPVIVFYQRGREYARAYECCWGCYYNCSRTRIGMYCEALDRAIP